VITFYPELEATARKLAPKTPIHTILPPAVDEGLPLASQSEADELRRKLKLGTGPVLVYTGTLENYQGLDILLESVSTVAKSFPTARYVIVGGKPEQVEELRKQARELGVADRVIFEGQRPLEDMPRYMAMADILLSPRSKGTHTPLKLYTYLRAGKPLLATSIRSHTQILTPDVALLVDPTSEGLANGTLTLLRDKAMAQELATRAKETAEQNYSWDAFLEKNDTVYSEFHTVTV
jgi:glycosyltransferase involved in cell wall biosynthesis